MIYLTYVLTYATAIVSGLIIGLAFTDWRVHRAQKRNRADLRGALKRRK